MVVKLTENKRNIFRLRLVRAQIIWGYPVRLVWYFEPSVYRAVSPIILLHQLPGIIIRLPAEQQAWSSHSIIVLHQFPGIIVRLPAEQQAWVFASVNPLHQFPGIIVRLPTEQ